MTEPVVYPAGDYRLAFAGLPGDRAGAGIVLTCLRAGVTLWVVTELGQHPGAEHEPQTEQVAGLQRRSDLLGPCGAKAPDRATSPAKSAAAL